MVLIRFAGVWTTIIAATISNTTITTRNSIGRLHETQKVDFKKIMENIDILITKIYNYKNWKHMQTLLAGAHYCNLMEKGI